MVTPVSNADTFSALNSASNATQTKNEAGSADRFLKLLVTQMQNQDPLNPMDNAQITSQMAQINTVNGIEKLNSTVEGLNTQFVQLQALAGASLVGRDLTLAGNKMAVIEGKGVGGFELAGTAGVVKVEVLNPAGRVVDTIDLGALNSGRHAFAWDAPEGVANSTDSGTLYTFRVNATQGGASVQSTNLMRDHVTAVYSTGSSLMLETLLSGTVAYGDVKALN
jgi:flagellar basal-body rod modification protein FlgD